MASATYVTRMFDRLDRICFEHYGSTEKRIVEIVLDANRDLALRGIILPMNLTLTLPEIGTAAVADPPVVKLLKLF